MKEFDDFDKQVRPSIRLNKGTKAIADSLAIYRSVRKKEKTESFNRLVINLINEAWEREKMIIREERKKEQL